MVFNYDDNGIEKRAFGPSVPKGDYPAVVVSTTTGLTKMGDDKVSVNYEIIDGEYKGKSLKNHVITFFKDRKKKGAGFALDFLKAIGEPWQGAFEVDEKRWIGKYCLIHVEHETFEGKTFAKVKWCKEYKAPEHDPFAKKEEESVPF